MPDDKILSVERSADGYMGYVTILSATSGTRYELHVTLGSGTVVGHDKCRGFEMRGDCRHCKQAVAELSERGWIGEDVPDQEIF